MEEHSLPAIGEFYRDAGYLERLLVRGRPMICPLEPLLSAVPAGARMLDLGCGNGLFVCASVLARQVDAIGCDVNARAVAGAQAMSARLTEFLGSHGATGSARFSVTSQIADWPAGPFGVVSAIDVLHHVPVEAQEAFIIAASDRVAEGGTFIYKDMSDRPFWMAAMNRLHDLVLARQWVNYFPVGRVVELLQPRGFTLAQRLDYSRLWYRHQLAVFRRGRGD